MYQESQWVPDLGNGWYQNPVIHQDIPDPSVIRVGDTFYYTGSTGMYYPSLGIYESRDLVNWRFLCYPFPKYQGNVWAPELVAYENRFYLYFCADGTNFVSVSDHMDHGWCDPIDLKIGRIDPGHCVYEGKRYLLLARNHMAPLSDDGLSVTGEMKVFCEPMPLPEEWDIEGPHPESPKMYKRGEWYYLIYAAGGTGGPATAHMVVCARAKNPVDGPWEFSPYNPMVHTWSRKERWHCKGHGCLVDDVNGRWWILYHAYEDGYRDQGRKILLEPVVFTEDGWPVIEGSGNAESPRRKPAGEKLPSTDALSDSFAGPLLPQWRMRGSVDYERAQACHGMLTFKACQADGPGKSHPIVVNPADRHYTVEVTLHKPAEGCEAGVILMYDETHFAALGWRGNELHLYRGGRDVRSFAAAGDQVRILMRNDHHYVSFSVAQEEGAFHKLNATQNLEFSNATAFGTFDSLRAGLYALGEGEAVFGPFVYRAEE